MKRGKRDEKGRFCPGRHSGGIPCVDGRPVPLPVSYTHLDVYKRQASSPEAEEHLQVTRELLQELGCGDVPILTVFNKCDLSPEPVRAEGPSVCISAKTGQGLPRLLEEVAAALPPDRKKVTLLLPFRQGALAEQCRREGAVERDCLLYTSSGAGEAYRHLGRILSGS